MAVVVTFIALVFAGWVVYTSTDDARQLENSIKAINPPQEILDGQVAKLVITVVYDMGSNTESQSKAVIYYCSGKNWVIPPGEINLIKKWLKYGKIQNRGCTP